MSKLWPSKLGRAEHRAHGDAANGTKFALDDPSAKARMHEAKAMSDGFSEIAVDGYLDGLELGIGRLIQKSQGRSAKRVVGLALLKLLSR